MYSEYNYHENWNNPFKISLNKNLLFHRRLDHDYCKTSHEKVQGGACRLSSDESSDDSEVEFSAETLDEPEEKTSQPLHNK